MARWLLVLALAPGVVHAAPGDCELQMIGFASSPHGDDMLVHAATCFERAHAARRAVQTLDLLVRLYPNSRHAMTALRTSARTSIGIGRLEDAAARYAAYARRYSGEQDAKGAMETAIRLRTALGDRRHAAADTDYYVKAWGVHAPQAAAAAALALALSYEAPAERIKALRAFLAQWGSAGGRDQVVTASWRLGEALWRSSCPVTPIDGLCIKLVPARGRDTCEPSTPRAVVVARIAGARQDAIATLQRTVKLVEDGKLEDAASRHALAMAKVALADDDLEKAMTTTFPTGLDFSMTDREVLRRSKMKFDDWIQSEVRASRAVRAQYTHVLELDDPQAAVIATARFGENAESFRRKLVTSEIPMGGGLRGKEAREAYCSTLEGAASSLAGNAKQAFGTCAAKAAALGVYDETVEMCMREAEFVEDEIEPALTLPLPELAHATVAEVEERAELALSQSHDQRPYVVLAMLALAGGKPQLANAYMSFAVDDKDPLVQAGRARVAAALGAWGQAVTAADQAVALSPNNADYVRLSAMIDVHLGRWDDASTRLDALAEGYDVLVARAIITRAEGDPQRAEQLYQRAIELDGARPEAHFDLGLLYELHTNPRDPGRASDEYKRAGTPDAKRRAAALAARSR